MDNGTLSVMRGSDAIDLWLDIAPRRWVRAFLLALIVLMSVTGWYDPVLWYVGDKAAAITETLLPVFAELPNTATTTRTPRPLPTTGQ